MVDESFIIEKVTRDELDALLSGGWRHLGNYFYRRNVDDYDGRILNIIPLRIDLERFQTTKSQRRILRQNDDLEVRIGRVMIDGEREQLFNMHAERFSFGRPICLENFLGYQTDEDLPCAIREISVRNADGRLLAASYVSVGKEAHSSIYAMFDPAESSRSLGNATILWEIEAAKTAGCRWLYMGYAHVEPSFYDYKKRFTPLQWYDWTQWRSDPLTGAHGMINSLL